MFCVEKCIILRDVSSLARFSEEWFCRLANLTDIFQKLNELHLTFQGFGNHIFSMQDKITAFYGKLFLFLRRAKTWNYATFCTLTDFMEQNAESTLKRETQEHIVAHSERMSVEFETYFPFLTAVFDGSTDWI
jgi:mevalonate kinase